MRTPVDKHICSRSFDNLRATSNWLAGKLLNRVKEQPNIKLTTIQEKIQQKFVVKVSKSKAYWGKRKAIEMVEGNHAKQYGKLRIYCNVRATKEQPWK